MAEVTILTPFESATRYIRGNSGQLDPEFKGILEASVAEEIPQSSLVALGGSKNLCICGKYLTEATEIGLIPTGETDLKKIALVNSQFDSDTNQISFNIPSTSETGWFNSSVEGIFDLIINIDKGRQIRQSGVIEVKQSTWIDFREGGSAIASGDFSMASKLSLVRDAEGVSFTGDSGWDTWASYDKLLHPDTEKKTYSFILPRISSRLMIGVGRENNNETSTAQYFEGEVMAYFTSSSSFWGFYGNRTSESEGANFGSGKAVKLVFENNAQVGSKFYLYELPGFSEQHWADTSKIIRTGTIDNYFSHAGVRVCPYFVPYSPAEKITALKVE